MFGPSSTVAGKLWGLQISFHGDLCHLGIYLVSAKLSYHTQHNIASTRTGKTDSCRVAGGYAGLQMQLRRATLVSDLYRVIVERKN